MSSISLTNFKYGLDARRSMLSSQPGTMSILNNCHITQGGEIEKRKAFVGQSLPQGTFGLLATSSTMLIFGSRNLISTSLTRLRSGVAASNTIVTFQQDGEWDLQVGDSLTIAGMGGVGFNGSNIIVTAFSRTVDSTVAIVRYTSAGGNDVANDTAGTMFLNLPTNVTYQRLVHPISGVVMTGVITATLFNDKAFVVTSWSNGDVLEYYDGVIVNDFISGQQNNLYPTAFAMANGLCAQLEATGRYTTVRPVLPTYLYVQVNGGSNGAGNYVSQITYNFGRNVTLNDSSSGGTLTATTFHLLIANVLFNTTNNQTATDIVTAINSSNYYGFVAVIDGTNLNQVNIHPPLLDGNGAALAVSDFDSITSTLAGNVQTSVTPTNVTFSVISIPTPSSSTPFVVNTTLNDAVLTYKLVSNGVPATLPSNASGQFTLINGGNNAQATGTLTFGAGNAVNNQTVTIGTRVYTFVTFLTGTANQIFIGSTGLISLANLVAAINGASGVGTLYSVGTIPNSSVSASGVLASKTTLTATTGGIVGNAIVTTTTTTAFTWGAATLTGGGSVASVIVKSSNVNVSDADTVTVGGKVYRFKNALAAINDVKIAASADLTLTNLLLAINLTGTAGTNYFAGTTINASVSVLNQDTTNHQILIVSKATGIADNSLTISKSAATLSLLKPDGVTVATGLTGGTLDSNQITQISIGAVNLLPNYVAFNKTVVQTASDLVTAINGYSGTSGFSATASAGTVTLLAVASGTSVNEALLSIICLGNVCVANAFFLLGGTGSIQTIVANGTIQLLTSTMTFQGTGYASENMTQFAARIVANINANTLVSGFLAYSVANQLWMSQAVVTTNDAAIAIVTTQDSTLAVQFGATTALNIVNNTSVVTFTNFVLDHAVKVYTSDNSPNSGVVSVTGGTTPYLYKWINTSTTSYATPQTTEQKNQWWTTKAALFGSGATETWVCQVTDSTAGTPQVVTSNPFYLHIP